MIKGNISNALMFEDDLGLEMDAVSMRNEKSQLLISIAKQHLSDTSSSVIFLVLRACSTQCTIQSRNLIYSPHLLYRPLCRSLWQSIELDGPEVCEEISNDANNNSCAAKIALQVAMLRIL